VKIKRIERGYTMHLTPHEFGILQRMTAGFNIDDVWPDMSSGERRSWSRRTKDGEFMRVDKDTREFKD